MTPETNQLNQNELLANMAQSTARFLTEAYGSPEAAAEAIKAGLANSDNSVAMAGAIHAQEQFKRMCTMVVSNPAASTKLIEVMKQINFGVNQ